MNPWNTLPESYQHRVYNNTLATVKRLNRQAENPTPTMVIRMHAAHADYAILLDYWTTEAAVEEAEIGSTDQNIPIVKHCTDDQLHFAMPRGSREYEDEGDKSNEHDAIPNASRAGHHITELDWCNLGTSDVKGMRARMVTMSMWMRRTNHCKSMMDQRRM
jgi:hypothetical protein